MRVSCPVGGADCAGKLTLRTRAKVKLGSRKAKLVTLARTVKYAVAKGKAKTLTLTLGLDGKNLVKRSRTQKVTLVLKPATGQVGDEEPHAAARLTARATSAAATGGGP